VGLAATHAEQMPHAGAGSGGGRNSAISRRMSANNVLGMATSVGNTVDVANASYTNMIGDAFLAAYWVDEDFDPEERAFYYVRVLEIPTPRWTAFDAQFFNIDMPDDVPRNCKR